MASQRIPLRLGAVDAVSGDVSLHVPLGPKLPGRIPVGFSWSYSNQDTGLHRNGGNFRPVVWPGGSSSPLSVSVVVDGDQWMFYKQAAPATGAMPTQAELLALAPALGVDTGQNDAYDLHTPNSLITTPIWDYTISPSSDGTRFFIRSDWKIGSVGIHGEDTVKKVAGRLIVLNGVNAIWTKLMPDLVHFVGVSYFTNRWGDQVTVTETGGAQGAPSSIVIKNELSGQTITLVLGFTGTVYSFTSPASGPFPCTITVTNSMSLPVASLTGANYNATERRSYVPPGSTDTPQATGIWDAGVTPSSIVVAPAGVTVNPLTFNWADPVAPILKVIGLTHPNGVTETFTYDTNTSRLSNDSYDPLTGYWRGYKVDELENCDLTCTFPTQPVNNDGEGVCAIQIIGSGISQKIVIARLVPTGHKTGLFAWDEKRHITSILRYANSTGTGTYRGVRIYHPAVDSWTDATGSAAYLFAASVVVGSEAIHGSSVDASGQPSGYTVDGVTLNDGWNLKSWANPTASLGSGLPVNPVARRTRTYAPGLPVRTVIAGANGGEDAFGPTQTDEYTDSTIPGTMPTVNTTTAPTWSSGITLPTGQPTHRNGTVTRTLVRGRWMLETGNDHKTLDGGNLNALRYDGNALPALTGVSSADFGTTAYGHDTDGRVTTVTGTRGGFVATETRTYGLTSAAGAHLPLVTRTVKTLNGYQANPADATVQVGHEYQYDSTSFQWLSAERDLVDGRWTYYQVDALGRITQTTDPLNVVTATTYDSWGRVASTTRQAIGTVGQPGYIGPVSTTINYDVYGLWKEETVSGAGATITTRTEFDAAGRVTAVKKYNGPTSASPLIGSQTTTYDGFGQKVSQTPWLKAGQSSYGTFTWAYDDQGRLTESRDRVGSAGTPAGRVLSTVTQQPTWMMVTGADGVSVTGVATTTQDDRGFTRTEVHDLLGQKAGIIDQKGQTSLYFYDKDGHLLQTKQGTGASTQVRSYKYNDMGWLLSRTEPEEGSTTYGTFTMLGTPLVATQLGRNGSLSNTVTTTLDSHLQPSQIVAQGPEGTVTRTLTFDYGVGHSYAPLTLAETQAITGLPTGNLSESYAYDALGRMKSKTIGDGSQSFTVSRVLDDVGNELSLSYPSGGGLAIQTATTTYDSQLRPATVSFAGTTRGTMAYDQLSGSSDTTTLTFGNNATTATKVDNGEVVLVTHSAAAGVLESNAVSWTAGGLMLSRGPSTGAGPDTFAYDQLQRLTSAHVLNPATGTFVDQTFSYDRFGNRSGMTTSAPAGTLPSPSEALTWTAAYDATNSLPATVSGLTTGVLYDQLGRMSQVWAIPGQSSSLTLWGYDPSGRVMKETVNGLQSAFLLDGSGLRFRRTRYDGPGGAAGTIDYTVYGFHQEPLTTFQRPLGQVHSGSKALQIFHKNGTNCSTRRYLGTFQAGDVVTATLWVNATVGTRAQVFLGNALSNGFTAFDNSTNVYFNGTGTWQQVTVTWTMTHADWMWVYGYGNTNTTGPDLTSTNYDDIVVSSVQRGTVMTEGFENGLVVATGNWDLNGWQSASEPTDIDVVGQVGALEWRKSLVYGFGQLLSEDQLLTGTIYEQSDQVGSPNLITDKNGVLKNRSKNLPFGERLLLPTPNAPKSTRRFTNHEDEDGSAIYMQARTYLPAYGKFAQVDPAYDQTKDDPESWNLYNYVTNNPVTHTDPDGRIATEEGMNAANLKDIYAVSGHDWGDVAFGSGAYVGSDALMVAASYTAWVYDQANALAGQYLEAVTSGDSTAAGTALAALGQFLGMHPDVHAVQPKTQTSAQTAPPPPPGGAGTTGSTGQNGAVLNSVDILGNPVKVTYANGMSDPAKSKASETVAAAAVLINSHAGDLTKGERSTIANIKEINIDPTASRSSVDVEKGIFHANAAQLGQSTARFASDLFHDGSHINQWRSGKDYTGANAEERSTRFQIIVGMKLGLSKSEVEGLTSYADNISNFSSYWNSQVTHN